MPLLSWERGTDEKELTSRWSRRLRVEQGGRCALSRPTNMFEKKSNCAISSSPFFISSFSCDVPLRQLSRSVFTKTKCCGYSAPLQPPPCSEHLVADLEDKGWVLSWPRSSPRKMRRRSCSASLVGREPGISQQTCSHTCDQVFKSNLIVTCPAGQISTLPGWAHQHGVFPRRSKVDVLLQHQRRTSGCVPAGL